MGGHGQQAFTLHQRFAHKAELIIFQIPQTTVDQLGAGRGGIACQIILLDQQDRRAAPAGVTRNAGAVNAPPDDKKVIDTLG